MISAYLFSVKASAKFIFRVVALSILVFNPAFAGTLTGEINSQEDGNPLPGVSIYIVEADKGTFTDEEGLYNLAIGETGKMTIEVRYLGYKSIRQTIEVEPGKTTLNFSIEPYWIEAAEHLITSSPVRTIARYQPVQNLNRNDLRTRQAYSLGEMLENEPGLNKRDFGSAPARPVIRGFDGERLLILENGERMGDVQESAHDHAVSIDPLAIEEIETIRGPASLIYGSNAIGGVVNIFTNNIPRSAQKGLHGSATLQGGSINNMFRGGVQLLHGGDRFNYQGRFSSQRAGETYTPDGKLPGSQGELYNFGTGFSYNNFPFKGGMSVNWNRQEYGLPELQVSEDPENPGQFIEEAENIILYMDRINVSGEALWFRDRFFEAMELRTSYSYLDQEEIEYEDDDDFDLELAFKKHTLSSTFTLRHGQYNAIENGVLGFNIIASDMDISGDEAFHPGEKLLSGSGFLFEEIRINPRLVWQAGIRSELRISETTPNHLFPEFIEQQNFHSLSGATGLNYQVTDNLESGLQVARAYRAPSVVELYASGWHAGAGQLEVGNPDLKPETSLGLDAFAHWKQNDFSANATLFYSHINDFITAFELEPGCPDLDLRADGGPEFARCIQYRAVNAIMWGLEFESQYDISNRLSVHLHGDMVQGTQTGEITQPLPYIPPARLNTQMRYNHENWHAAVHVRGALAQKRVAENELPTEGYMIPGLSAGYQFLAGGTHRIILQVRNPFNQRYFNHLSRVRTFPDPELGPQAPVRFPEAGRNIMLGYYWDF
jgi:iron complex outermembrane recepter protein